jgi:hypothetical protein
MKDEKGKKVAGKREDLQELLDQSTLKWTILVSSWHKTRAESSSKLGVARRSSSVTSKLHCCSK